MSNKSAKEIDRYLVLSIDFKLKIGLWKKNSIGPVFSKLVSFIKKLSVMICSSNSKSFSLIYFDLRNLKKSLMEN